MKSFVRRADLILLSALLLTSLLIFAVIRLVTPRGTVAVISVDGIPTARLPLKENTTFDLNGTHTVVVRDGKVFVESAPCRDQICVRHAPVSREGETIVCLPYHVTITVTAEGRGSP